MDSVSVSPVSKDIDGNEQYGGKGHNRDNPPNVLFIAQVLGLRKITPPQKHMSMVLEQFHPSDLRIFMIQFGKREMRVAQFPNLLFGKWG